LLGVFFMRLISSVAPILAVSLLVVACSSSGSDEPAASTDDALGVCNLACIQGTHCVVHGQKATCVSDQKLCKKPNACGPALGMPNHLCPDGVTVAGPTGNCLQGAGGCYWEVISCP
jgi:hypothetical protein